MQSRRAWCFPADNSPLSDCLWTSHPRGFDAPADPSAQQVEFSLSLFDASQPDTTASSTLTVYGVSWLQIGEWANIIGLPITIRRHHSR
jgi:hypothetical protein